MLKLNNGLKAPLISLIALTAISSANALTPLADPLNKTNQSSAQNVRGINVPAGQTTIVDLSADARDIIVSNPTVLSASLQSNRKLLINGLSTGVSTLYILDKEGRQIASYSVIVAQETSQLQNQLRTILPKSSITVTSVGNALLLTGQVATAADAALAVDLAKSLTNSSNGNSAQNVVNKLTIQATDIVMLKVTVAEISRNIVKQLGISHQGTWNIGDIALSSATASSLTNIAGNSLNIANNSGSKSLKLDALEEIGVARVIGEPTATARSGETGVVHLGGQIPVPVGMDCANNSTCQPNIEFKNFGTTLNFTPLVLDNGRISLNLEVETSEVDNTNATRMPATNGQTLVIPGFKNRRSTTTVELPSGGSLVSAGLIQVDNRTNISGVPGLMNLPILGSLFRSKNYQRHETELVIIVTPYIAKPIAPGKIARPDDNLIDANEPASLFMGKINRIYSDKTKPASRQNIQTGKPGFIIE